MVWKGEVQVSWVEEFGKVWGSVELGILREVEMGSGEEFQMFWGGVWVGAGRGRVEVIARCRVKLGEGFGMV